MGAIDKNGVALEFIRHCVVGGAEICDPYAGFKL